MFQYLSSTNIKTKTWSVAHLNIFKYKCQLKMFRVFSHQHNINIAISGKDYRSIVNGYICLPEAGWTYTIFKKLTTLLIIFNLHLSTASITVLNYSCPASALMSSALLTLNFNRFFFRFRRLFQTFHAEDWLIFRYSLNGKCSMKLFNIKFKGRHKNVGEDKWIKIDERKALIGLPLTNYRSSWMIFLLSSCGFYLS